MLGTLYVMDILQVFCKEKSETKKKINTYFQLVRKTPLCSFAGFELPFSLSPEVMGYHLDFYYVVVQKAGCS